MSRRIDYGNLMHRAMRGLIQDVLTDVQEKGLPGDHHFFITFDTAHPDVQIADWLSDRYPSEMTVVMQHWFDKLMVNDEGFAVTLNFGDQPERLFIPYDAIKTFVDPSVEFGLRFESHEEEDEDDSAEARPAAPVREVRPARPRPDKPAAAKPTPAGETPKDADIVSLDSFRK